MDTHADAVVRPADAPAAGTADGAAGVDEFARRVHAAHTARWAALDAAVAAPATLPRAARMDVARADGSAALGVSTFSRVDSGSAEATFRALAEYRLRARVAGPDVRGVFGDLLDRWVSDVERRAAAGRDDEGRADPVLSLTWPSRDAEVIAAVLGAGFRPRNVLALRRAPAGTHDEAPGPALPGTAAPPGTVALPDAPAPPGVVVRAATGDDHEAVLDAQVAELAYDDLVGGAYLRAQTRARMSPLLAAAIRRGAVLVAEAAGEVVGVVGIEPPAWSAGTTATLAAKDVSYLVVLHVRADMRGRGIGAALAQAALRMAPGPVALHYSAHNPLSVPFWSRLGFRPVMTAWIRPVGGRP